MGLRDRIADTIARAAGLQTRRCPHGCGLIIRFRAVSKTEADQLTAIAADHAGRHQYLR